jgi:hypothetical protein
MPDAPGAKRPPIAWPQEKVTPPPGWGGMARVDIQNTRMVRREFFVLSGYTSLFTYGQNAHIILPTPDYGDFWCAAIAVQPVTDAPVITNNVDARIQITDIRNQYSLFFPDTRVNLLRLARPGDIANLIEPYCFTRTGGVRVTVTMDTKIGPLTDFEYHVALYGWLEYVNASK